jgi:hypothetical protein
MNLSRRERWIALVALVTVGIWVLDLWALSPLWASYQEDVEKALVLEQELFKVRRLLRRESELEACWRERHQSGIGQPVSAAEGGLLGAMEQWATESGVGLTSMKPDRRPPADGVQLIRCRAAARGNMAALTRLCWLMENAEMPLRLEKLQITSPDDARDSVTMQLEVSTICLAEKKEKPSARAARTE